MRRARQKSMGRETGKPMRPHSVKKVKKVKKRRKGSLLKWILGIFVALVAVMVVGLGIGFVDESDLLAPIDPASGKVNALLLGVDRDGLRSDSIMVASFDLETSELNLMSIPRDTKIYVKNRSMTRKINEIHALPTKKSDGTIAGPIGMAEAVTQLTGIPINYYVEFSFDAAENVIDTLGKITYDVPDVEGGGKGMNYEDPAQDLYIHLEPGVQKLDGEKILQLMRYRKGDSDHARSERQQNVIKAIIEQKLGLSLILKLPKLFTQIKTDLSTNISASDVTKYAQYLGNLSVDKVNTYQLPGSDERQNGKWYYICDIEETKRVVNEDFGIEVSSISNKIEVHAENSKAKANIK